jgi:hypothetical protein
MKANEVKKAIEESGLKYFTANDEHQELSWFPRQAAGTSDRIKLDHIDSLTIKDGFLILKSTIGSWFGMKEYHFHTTILDIVRMK